MDRRHPSPLFWTVTWKGETHLSPEARHTAGTSLNACPEGGCGISAVYRQLASSLHTLNCTQRKREKRLGGLSLIFVMLCSHIMLSLCKENCWGIALFFLLIVLHEGFLTCCPFIHLENVWPARCVSGLLWMFSTKVKLHHLLKKCVNLLKTTRFCN